MTATNKPRGRTKRMQATARMASVVSSTPPARRRLIRVVMQRMEESPVLLVPFHQDARGASYLDDLQYNPGGRLAVRIVGTSEQIEGRSYRYDFDASCIRGFLLLDEGDLITIWEPEEYSPNAAPLYEVNQGSIFEGMSRRSGVLSVSIPFERLENMKEYLIATDDDCILVLSSRPPRITEIQKQA